MVLNESDEVLTIPFKLAAYVVAGLPLSALTICVIISMIIHWDEATRTHCGVPNYFPSISAAVASYAPERYIWRFLIALHSMPRFAMAFAYRNYMLYSPMTPISMPAWFRWLCNFTCLLNVTENFFLLMLTSISSVEDYALHKISFCMFMICSLCYMIFHTWLFDYSKRRRTTALGEQSFQYKIMCCGGEIVFLLLGMYFFWRHNTYCEPFIYTYFALCEYAIVVFNIFFHYTASYDFQGKKFVLVTHWGGFDYELLPKYASEKTT